MVFRLSVELGGHHAVQDDWNTVPVTRRDVTWRLRSCANHGRSAGNYPNSDRRNQTVDCDGRATLFQSRECHSPVGREEQRLCGQQHRLPDFRIDRGLARWRDQNAQRRRGAVRRRREDVCAEGGQWRAIELPPLLPCPRCGLGSARRGGTCRRTAQNGAPDCQAASLTFCRGKGFQTGKTLDTQSEQKCPTKLLLEGRAPNNTECPTEIFVTRAMCQ